MIDIYIKPTCPYCISAKELLDSKGQSYQAYDISHQPRLKQEMVERANGRSTVPQIFIDDKHIGGCDDLYALENQGQLDRLLNKKNEQI